MPLRRMSNLPLSSLAVDALIGAKNRNSYVRFAFTTATARRYANVDPSVHALPALPLRNVVYFAPEWLSMTMTGFLDQMLCSACANAAVGVRRRRRTRK